MPHPAAEGEAEGAAPALAPQYPEGALLLQGLARLHEAIGKAGGTAGVLGVAVASPVAFSKLPWLAAVLAVFLVGLAVELGPGLLLEALGKRAEAAAARKRKQEEEESLSPERAGGGAAVSSSSSSSLRRRRGARPRPLDEEGLSPTAAGGGNSGGSQIGTPTAAARPAGQRDASLKGARLEVTGWRVVEGAFASYKIVVTCPKGGGGSWTVWRRFSDFESLREALLAGRSNLSSSLPLLPAKTLWKNLSPKFLTKRSASLQAFLQAVISRPALSDDPALRTFLNSMPLVTAPSRPLESAAGAAAAESQPSMSPSPPPRAPSPAASEEGVPSDSVTEEEQAQTQTQASQQHGAMEGRTAPGLEAKGGSGEEGGAAASGSSNEDSGGGGEGQGQQLHHACRPGDPDQCLPGGGNLSALALASAEEEEEEDEEEALQRASGERPTLSTASTDDGVEDEERAREAARSILETMRELSAHSPTDWALDGDGDSHDDAGAGASGSAALPKPPATLAEAAAAASAIFPASCDGMSLEAYQTLSLRLQHPTAYYDAGPTHGFHVRGQHYMLDGRKVPAGRPLGTLVLAMVFTIPPDAPGGREDHMASRGRVAERLAALRELDARDGRPPFNFVLNFQVPGDPPLSLVLVFALPRDQRPEEDGNFWPLFERFLDFAPVHTADAGASGSSSSSSSPSPSAPVSPTGVFPLDDLRNKRFKLIPAIIDGPGFIKWAVGAKPTILGQKLTQRYFRGEDYVELDVDIASSAVASQVVGLCRGYARHLQVQMAIVLQGENEGELPEKLIGCVGIDHLDINRASDGPNVLER